MAFNFSPKIVTNGLVLHLDAASRKSYVSGSTTWNDLSRSQVNGTLVNGVAFNSANAGSIVFDGVDDRCDMNYITPTTYTIEVSVVFTGLTTGQRAIVDYGNIAGTPIRLYLTDSVIKLQHGPGFGEAGLLSLSTVTTNTFYGITATYGLGSGSLYVNTVLQSQSALPTSQQVTSLFALANKPSGSASQISPLTCRISNLKIYNRALTQQEITQNYNATKGRYGL